MSNHTHAPRLLAILVGTILFWNPLTADSLEYFEDVEKFKPHPEIILSEELENQRAQEIKDGSWALTIGLAEQLGFNSNLYHSPADDGFTNATRPPGQLPVETLGSAFAATSLLLKAGKRFAPEHGLDLSFAFADARFFENNLSYDQTVKLDAGYNYDLFQSLRLFAKLGYWFQNSEALDIYGLPYIRDYSYAKYLGDLGGRFDLNPQHRLGLFYRYLWQDYGEEHAVLPPVTLNTLDSTHHAVHLRYRFMPHPSTKMRLWYTFQIKNFKEVLSAQSDGLVMAGAPWETNNFHNLVIWVSHEPNAYLSLSAKYRMRSKVDTYQGYESYVQHGGELMVRYEATLMLALELAAGLNARGYENRSAVQGVPTLPVDPQLTNDFWFINLTSTYQLDEFRSLFGGYVLRTRSTNRLIGINFMDYAVHYVGAGISMAF